MLELIHYNDSYRSAVIELHEKSLVPTGAFLPPGDWDEDLRNIARHYRDGEGAFLLGIMDNTLVCMGAVKKLSPDLAEIKRMRVHPDYQRRGFGRLVLGRLEGKAREMRINKLCLTTTSKQTAAQKLYAKNGYREVARGLYAGLELIHFEKAMLPLQCRAVVFDLFGTLVPNPSLNQRNSVLQQMAALLNVPLPRFNRLWDDTFISRDTGVFATIEENIEYIGRSLGVGLTKSSIEMVARLRIDYVRELLVPRPESPEVLSRLKSLGYKLGLISDCSPEVPWLWPETPFISLIDKAVFSCSVKMKKPDPRIYRLVAEKLQVPLEKCLYIGDGSSNELTGARQAGMYPVLIRADDIRDAFQIDAEGDRWQGPSISSLPETLNFLE